MAIIKKYTKKDGSTAYMFKTYLGIDPVTGKQRETTRRGFSTPKEAKLALARLEVEIQENGLKERPKIRTYKDVFEDWFELVYKHKVKESTFWNTRLIFDKHILPAFGTQKVKSISVTMCQKQANKWAQEYPKRFQRYINYAGMVFKYAISIDETANNPIDKIEVPGVNNICETEDNFYTKDELLEFLNAMHQDMPFKRYAFFFLLSYTGMRKGEALALEWRDIDFKAKTITINKTVATGKNGSLLIQQPKTKESYRTITLDDSTINVLKKWHKEQKKIINSLNFISSINQLVFSKDIDNSLLQTSTPRNWLDVIYRHNKQMKRITPHGFRHTHCSLLFEAKASMKQVQTRLGHSNIKTTMNVYAHVTKDGQEETALLFDNYMSSENNLGQSLGQNKNPAQ